MKRFQEALKESILTPSYGTAEAMNEQLNKELASAYLYDIAAHYFERRNLKGFAKMFKEQAREEREHAELFRKFLLDTGAPVVFKTIEVVDQNFSSVMEVARKALAHEEMITESIHRLCEMAESGNDKATKIFLKDFVTEQIDEERGAKELILKLEMIGNDGSGILQLDSELLV